MEPPGEYSISPKQVTWRCAQISAIILAVMGVSSLIAIFMAGFHAVALLQKAIAVAIALPLVVLYLRHSLLKTRLRITEDAIEFTGDGKRWRSLPASARTRMGTRLGRDGSLRAIHLTGYDGKHGFQIWGFEQIEEIHARLTALGLSPKPPADATGRRFNVAAALYIFACSAAAFVAYSHQIPTTYILVALFVAAYLGMFFNFVLHEGKVLREHLTFLAQAMALAACFVLAILYLRNAGVELP